VPYNLDSPNQLLEPCVLANLASWFTRECMQVADEHVRSVLNHVADHLDGFIAWPEKAMLLWQGCDRMPEVGKKLRYHSYPDGVKEIAKRHGVSLDTRPNGPAIAAYLIAGGHRPPRFGSANAWSIHHLYSGKFPYIGKSETTHATKLADHFTQSAGLVATHPIADALGDEYPFFAWMLRAMAFQRFGYDPDGVFSPNQDEFGFAGDHGCEVACTSASST